MLFPTAIYIGDGKLMSLSCDDSLIPHSGIDRKSFDSVNCDSNLIKGPYISDLVVIKKDRMLLSDEEREILDTNGASLRIDKEKHEASRQALNVRSRRAMRI